MQGIALLIVALLVGGAILALVARFVRKLGPAPESDIGDQAHGTLSATEGHGRNDGQPATGSQSPTAGGTGRDEG